MFQMTAGKAHGFLSYLHELAIEFAKVIDRGRHEMALGQFLVRFPAVFARSDFHKVPFRRTIYVDQ